MSDFHVRLFDRSWDRLLLPIGVTLKPIAWDAEAIGGSSTMEIEATGDISRLTELANWPGSTLWIMNTSHEYVWWGDIEEVEFAHNGAVIGVTLEGVVNKLKVLYTDDAPGGEMASAETAWAQDDASILLYGRRERQHTAQMPMRAPQAVQMRDTLLERVARPTPILGQVAAGDETVATIRGNGFWKRLSRLYYANDNGMVEHTDGSTPWPLGMGFTSAFTAAVSTDGDYSIWSMYGRFKNFTAPDLRVSVTGSTGNDGIFTVTGNDTRDPISYTNTTIKFVPDDDIEDSTPGFADIAGGDLIQVSGSALNSKTHLIKTPGVSRIEISPGYAGDTIQNEMPGPSINILRGNSITVEQPVANEHSGATWVVTAHGERIAQGFHTYTSGSWILASVELKLRKVGTPLDGVYCRLRADGATTPDGAILDSVLVDDADIDIADGGTWTEFVMPGGVTLAPATLYWLEIVRSGANDTENYYEVYVDDTGAYAGGGSMLHNGTNYVSPLNPLSVCFRLLGAVDTATQVAAMCEAAGVFNEVLVQDLSGLKTNQYRDGSMFSADQALELLDTGDGSSTRMLANVNPQRTAIIRTQPASTSAQYVWRDGALLTLQGVPVAPGLLPVGEWCHLDSPAILNGALAQASPFFIEYAAYRVDQGWTLRAAGEPDPWMIGTVRDG